MLSKRLKVLTIGRFYPPSHGGIERHIDQLLQGLGHTIQMDCIVFDNKQPLITPPSTLPYNLYKAPVMGILASTPLSPRLPGLVRKLYQSNHYDILHLHLPNPMAHVAAYFLPRKVKLVLSWHSDIVKQKNLLKFYWPFLRQLVKRADAIIAATPAHFSSSTQLKNIDSSRFFVVPYGINIKQLNENRHIAASHVIKAKYQSKTIIFAMGRHVYYKGFEYLIQAMPHTPNTILLLGGTGPLTPQLRSLRDTLNLQDKIKFLGRITDDELAAYYHAADIFCLPSVEPSEAFGLVQTEAMACKKPVICCELNNGVTYVNQHNNTGLVVPPRNPIALATAINTLLQNEALRLQMGENALERVTTEFSQEKMWTETLSLYEKLLS